MRTVSSTLGRARHSHAANSYLEGLDMRIQSCLAREKERWPKVFVQPFFRHVGTSTPEEAIQGHIVIAETCRSEREKETVTRLRELRAKQPAHLFVFVDHLITKADENLLGPECCALFFDCAFGPTDLAGWRGNIYQL